MTTIVQYAMTVQIPSWVTDLASFRRWAHSDEFPEEGQICFLGGEVWVDMSKEQVFTHNQVKNEIAFVLTGLSKAVRRGRYFPDGILLSNEDADLSCNPDGCFVSRDALDAGRVRLVPGKKGGFTELEGSPDMGLEIVSTSSVAKDTATLHDLYWRAGVTEYWLVDARGAEVLFNIFRHTARGYVATRKSGGWVKSTVFGKSFRLTRGTDERGDPEFTLEVK